MKNGLFNIKKWYSLEEAASRLSQTFGTKVSLLDVVQFIAEDQLAPFWRLENEYLLPYHAVRFRDEAGNHCFNWDKRNLLSLQSGVYEVLFAHGEHSNLKRNLRRFLKGESPDMLGSAATFVRDADGEVYYIMKCFDEVVESWGFPKSDGDTASSDTVLVKASGEPFKRYEYPVVNHDGYGLTFSSIVPDVLEIIVTKKEIERFEKVALQVNHLVTDWAQAIRSEATRWYIEQLEGRRGMPTKVAISKEMAVWCRNNEITTDTGEYPKAEYIRRHVLNSWKKP